MELGVAARDAGYRLTYVDETGSTNDLALSAAETGDPGRRWFVAGRQTAGRGRQGRAWTSPAGNLHATLLLVDPCPVADLPRLGFVAGIATRAAVLDTAPGLAALALKWPNDLLVAGAKFAGILLEGRRVANRRQAVAIGIGVNVAAAPDRLPYPATCLSAQVAGAVAAKLLQALSDRIVEALALFDGGTGFEQVRRVWMAGAIAPGSELTVRGDRTTLVGRFAGIDSAGRLMLRTGDELKLIDAADVQYQPEAAHAKPGVKGNVVA